MDQRARLDLAQLLTAAKPIMHAFPGEIWLAHELVVKSDGKLDKPPVEGFRTNDPTSWCDLPAAIKAGGAGVGFIIVQGMVTFDFDSCVRSDGKVAPEVLALIKEMDSFSYRTVSGRGMRVVCRNDAANPVPPGKRTMYTADGHKIELFVGPCTFYNTFSTETDGKPVRPVARHIIDRLLNGGESRARSHSNDNYGEFGRTSGLGKKAKNIDTLLAALLMIPHGKQIDRDRWVKIGLGIYSGTGGTERGRNAFIEWSTTWYRHDEDPDGHLAAAETLWESFHDAPPAAIGAGTIFNLAKQYGWTWPKAKPATTTKSRRSGRFFKQIEVRQMRDFVEGLLEDGTLVMLFGPSGCGKTFLLLDLLLHIAWGRPWFGRQVKQGPTLLFALEGIRGVERRCVAFRRHHQVLDLPFKLYTHTLDLTDPESVDELIEEIKAQTDVFGVPVRAIAIDTLASAGVGDENTAEAMNPVLAECHRIKQATGACVVLVHHPGKDRHRGPRGFSGIGGTLDTLIEIRHEGKGKPRQIIAQKQRDLDLHDDLFYRLKVVQLGIDSWWGKPTTSCVVEPILGKAERALAAAQTLDLTPQQRLALDALHEALDTHGINMPDGKPARRVVERIHWIHAFRDRHPGTAKNTLRLAVWRSRLALEDAGLIDADKNWLWFRCDEPA